VGEPRGEGFRQQVKKTHEGEAGLTSIDVDIRGTPGSSKSIGKGAGGPCRRGQGRGAGIPYRKRTAERQIELLAMETSTRLDRPMGIYKKRENPGGTEEAFLLPRFNGTSSGVAGPGKNAYSLVEQGGTAFASGGPWVLFKNDHFL